MADAMTQNADSKTKAESAEMSGNNRTDPAVVSMQDYCAFVTEGPGVWTTVDPVRVVGFWIVLGDDG